jgi:hypothetical protein
MVYPGTQIMLLLARERQEELRRQAEADRARQETTRETRARRYRLRLIRRLRGLRPQLEV